MANQKLVPEHKLHQHCCGHCGWVSAEKDWNACGVNPPVLIWDGEDIISVRGPAVGLEDSICRFFKPKLNA